LLSTSGSLVRDDDGRGRGSAAAVECLHYKGTLIDDLNDPLLVIPHAPPGRGPAPFHSSSRTVDHSCLQGQGRGGGFTWIGKGQCPGTGRNRLVCGSGSPGTARARRPYLAYAIPCNILTAGGTHTGLCCRLSCGHWRGSAIHCLHGWILGLPRGLNCSNFALSGGGNGCAKRGNGSTSPKLQNGARGSPAAFAVTTSYWSRHTETSATLWHPANLRKADDHVWRIRKGCAFQGFHVGSG
jgi:hypothetical protein